MTPSVPLVAHYKRGEVREISLRVIAISPQNVMLVLWENKLVPVHQPPMGLQLDRVEILVEPPATSVVNVSVQPEPKKPGRPKKVESDPEKPDETV